MTNHPNRSRTYWQRIPRGFANEYDIGIATTKEHAEQYAAEGFKRINRETALADLSCPGNDATQVYVSLSIDGEPEITYDRFEIARSIRVGTFR